MRACLPYSVLPLHTCNDYSRTVDFKNKSISESPQRMDGDIEIQFKLKEYSEGFRVHPNPTKSIVNISLNKPQTENGYLLFLMDVFGTTVYQNQFNSNKYQIDLSNYPKGIYLLKISNENETYVKKILKQ